MTFISGYMYPWDTGERMDRILELVQPDRVALAGLYHAVRAVSFSGSAPRVVDAWHTASYLPRGSWLQGTLRPPPPSGWAAENAFCEAGSWLAERGVPTDAWLVFSHLEGTAAGECAAVVNAVGERLPHTQCPGSPEMLDYAMAAVDAALVDGQAHGLVLEGVAALGAAHPVGHDKTGSLDRSEVQVKLASWCFCFYCQQRRGDEGGEMRDILRAAIDGRTSINAPEVVHARQRLAEDRITLLGDRFRALAARARSHGCRRVAAFVTPEYDEFGPAAPIAALEFSHLDLAIVSGWDEPERTARRLEAANVTNSASSVGVYSSALTANGTTFSDLEQWPIDEIHLYHLGLASEKDLLRWLSGKK
ncbi:hypothetical protein GCM10027590_56270 [Nocardiopsis nanhaiensis]